jgi:N-methylhydantoinase B
LPAKPPTLSIPEGTTLIVQTPGGGGYGDPAGRDVAHRELDTRGGKYSQAAMARLYAGGKTAD